MRCTFCGPKHWKEAVDNLHDMKAVERPRVWWTALGNMLCHDQFKDGVRIDARTTGGRVLKPTKMLLLLSSQGQQEPMSRLRIRIGLKLRR